MAPPIEDHVVQCGGGMATPEAFDDELEIDEDDSTDENTVNSEGATNSRREDVPGGT